MIDQLGPQAQRVYRVLREQIVAGDLAPGTRLAKQSTLAGEFGVALMTLRHSWPDRPLAAITGAAQDLTQLQGSPEYPILVVPKPIRADHLKKLLHLVLPSSRAPAAGDTDA